MPVDAEYPLESGVQLSLLRVRKDAVVSAAAISSEGQSASKCVVVVLLVGGYEFLSYREDRKVALAFARHGFDAVVLRYHVRTLEQVCASGKGVGREALLDVAQAIDNISHNAEWGLQDRKIVLCGFLAGGHLAASLCTLYDHEELTTAQAWLGLLRPDGAILGYTVMSARQGLAHSTPLRLLRGALAKKTGASISVLLMLIGTRRLLFCSIPQLIVWYLSVIQ